MVDYTKAIIVFKQNNADFASVGLDSSAQLIENQEKTLSILEKHVAQKIIFYSDYLEREDIELHDNWIKMPQFGDNLSARIKDAFKIAKSGDYKEIIFVQCLTQNLTLELIEQAFEKLITADVVVGNDSNNQCYLLGFKQFLPEFFDEKNWTKAPIASDIEEECDKQGFSMSKLVTSTNSVSVL